MRGERESERAREGEVGARKKWQQGKTGGGRVSIIHTVTNDPLTHKCKALVKVLS